MKKTFYRPEKIDVDEFQAIVKNLMGDLGYISKGYAPEDGLVGYVGGLVADQEGLPQLPGMGFWGLAEPKKMPSDARVDFFYTPTYIATAILLNCKLNYPRVAQQVPGFDKALKEGLLATTARGFQGHGYEATDGWIEVLNIFITAKAHLFVKEYPSLCQEFTQLFNRQIESCRQALAAGNTRGPWGEDYSVKYKCVFQALGDKAYPGPGPGLGLGVNPGPGPDPGSGVKPEPGPGPGLKPGPGSYLDPGSGPDSGPGPGSREGSRGSIRPSSGGLYLFVYGTLMSTHDKGRQFLKGARLVGKATLGGYALYDLGSYPGIVAEDNQEVKGELYAIPEESIPGIDRYEGEGSLFVRKKAEIQCQGNTYQAYVYVYNMALKGEIKINYADQPWQEGIACKTRDRDKSKDWDKSKDQEEVWYASYGSNVNRERFMKYIDGDEERNKPGTTDKTPPRAERPIILKHPIYFANTSKVWNYKGVAFLDLQQEGQAYGRMYLITRQQLEEIHIQEGKGGSWYNKLQKIGHEGGRPVYTITHYPRHKPDEETIPDPGYYDTIKEGVSKTYPDLSHNDIHFYLLDKILKEDMLRILRYLRSQPHGVKISKICDGLGEDKPSLVKLIEGLKDLGLIRQDSRNRGEGVSWDAEDATYYTRPDRRAVIDRLTGSS